MYELDPLLFGCGSLGKAFGRIKDEPFDHVLDDLL
jgi:hypothetical protein